MSFFRDIVHHSAVYGLAQVLLRVSSVLLLPLYTHYLRPADYGCIAILDLTTGVLITLITPVVGSAVSRHHFEARERRAVERVWWTGITLGVLLATVLVIPTWLAREGLARLTLGSEQARGGFYYGLSLPLIWLSIVGVLPDTYLRIRKWSGIFLGLSVGRLLLNIGLNVYFLVVLRMGVGAVLLGNLIAAAVEIVPKGAILIHQLGRYTFSKPLACDLFRFGAPLAITSLLALLMHNADRYLLRLFLNMDQVGIYSIAYSIGQGVATLALLPFLSVWSVVIYEIAKQPRADRIYTLVFRYFNDAMMLLMLGVSLFSRPILMLVAPPDYLAAADLIPIVCLAYVLFAFHRHFEVPALVAKRTVSILPASIVAALLNLLLNLGLIPRWGGAAAAWVSVLTYGTYSFLGLWCYRRIERYDYPLIRCGIAMTGMITTVVGCRALAPVHLAPPWSLAIPTVAWVGWAIGLGAGPAWGYFQGRVGRTEEEVGVGALGRGSL